ncbi:MAG: carbohydrate binding family 9 domain-containing protein, partial [Candidatus Aminicenantes bacterium]|nr:carbohydrate binding family 9 domain-containing protein [Candidatus Aminicenantes bacterium]
MGYDDNAIYIAARMHDSEPDKIISLLARRDNFVEADYFLFYVDPYYDKRSGFKFAVNPSGSIADWTIYNDGWDDSSWDGVWEAKTTIDEKGWTVEMKIPFDQLRFKKKTNGDEYTWGCNFRRYLRRKNEIATYSWIPKTVNGQVSHYAKLAGIKGINPKRLFELNPYTIAKANLSQKEEGNPFRTGSEYSANVGIDLKYGLSSSLTLDLTANPDFGQVEVDPAVINLSAGESYYSEKRPFFVEGAHIFSFGNGGASDNWGANWGSPRFFYSRRIGRPPLGYVDTDGYTDYPEWSTILTAAKLSGKIGSGWSLGVMTAFTQREYAQVDLDGERSEGEVEPFTNYTVLRAQKEFNKGKQGLGFIATSVLRDTRNEDLASMMNKEAYG